jgi:hypothetical protein
MDGKKCRISASGVTRWIDWVEYLKLVLEIRPELQEGLNDTNFTALKSYKSVPMLPILDNSHQFHLH